MSIGEPRKLFEICEPLSEADNLAPEERDKPLCLRAHADLPLLGMDFSEVEQRILLAARIEAQGDAKRISYS